MLRDRFGLFFCESFPAGANKQELTSLPYRLVHHQTCEKNGHLDLFILPDHRDFLLTYELDLKYENRLKQEKQALLLLAAVNSTQGPFEYEYSETPDVYAVRKANHRLVYWDHNGPIAQKRGEIWEINRGKIFCNLL